MSKFVKIDGLRSIHTSDYSTSNYSAYSKPLYLNIDYIVRFQFTDIDGKNAVIIDTSESSGLRLDCQSISFDVDYFNQLAEITDIDSEPTIHHGKSFKKFSGKDLNNYE